MSSNPLTSLPILLGLLAFALLPACATYSDNLRQAQTEVINGNTENAISLINQQLDLDSSHDLPVKFDKDIVLLLLERATLLQAIGDYKHASQHMISIDQRMEFLDIDATNRVELAKWLFSGDAEKYQAPGFERLILNIYNLINFLAIGDLQGARVEARRFHIISQYFIEQTNAPILPELFAFGNYLAGFTFEKSRDFELALRFYSDAVDFNFNDSSFDDRIVDLMRTTGSTKPKRDSDKLRALAKQASSLGLLPRADFLHKYADFDLVVIVQTGLVPYKKPNFIPLGAALSLAAVATSPSYALSSNEISQAKLLLANGALSSVNVPELVADDVPLHPPFTLTLDNSDFEKPVIGLELYKQVDLNWQYEQPALIAAALTRAIARAAVGVGANVAGHAIEKSDSKKSSLGLLVSLGGIAAQAALTVNDRPDTRSWIFLPSNIFLFRTSLSDGPHSIFCGLHTGSESQKVSASKNHFILINFSKFRR